MHLSNLFCYVDAGAGAHNTDWKSNAITTVYVSIHSVPSHPATDEQAYVHPLFQIPEILEVLTFLGQTSNIDLALLETNSTKKLQTSEGAQVCCCWSRQLDRDVPGETLDLGLPDRTMTPPLVSFSLPRASFWSKCWLEGTRGGAVLHLPQGRRRIPAA